MLIASQPVSTRSITRQDKAGPRRSLQSVSRVGLERDAHCRQQRLGQPSLAVEAGERRAVELVDDRVDTDQRDVGEHAQNGLEELDLATEDRPERQVQCQVARVAQVAHELEQCAPAARRVGDDDRRPVARLAADALEARLLHPASCRRRDPPSPASSSRRARAGRRSSGRGAPAAPRAARPPRHGARSCGGSPRRSAARPCCRRARPAP